MVAKAVDIGVVIGGGEEAEKDERQGPDVLGACGQVRIRRHIVEHHSPEADNERRAEDADDCRWTKWRHKLVLPFCLLSYSTKVEYPGFMRSATRDSAVSDSIVCLRRRQRMVICSTSYPHSRRVIHRVIHSRMAKVKILAERRSRSGNAELPTGAPTCPHNLALYPRHRSRRQRLTRHWSVRGAGRLVRWTIRDGLAIHARRGACAEISTTTVDIFANLWMSLWRDARL